MDTIIGIVLGWLGLNFLVLSFFMCVSYLNEEEEN